MSKKTIRMLLGIIMIMCFFALPANALTVNYTSSCADCDKKEAGYFCNTDEQYLLDEKVKTVPLTFEAVFSVQKEGLKERTTILGSDDSYFAGLAYAVNEKGQPFVMIRDKMHYTQKYIYTFDEVDVATGKDIHLSVVFDFANKKLLCYVDGKLAQTLTGIASISVYDSHQRFVVGGDYNRSNATYFTGELKAMALWSDIRTSEEIRADHANGIQLSDPNLKACYDFTRCTNCMKRDLSGNQADLTHMFMWMSKDTLAPVTDYKYSFAVVGDTQKMSQKDPEAMNALYDWILENKDKQKMQCVIGLGDITENSYDHEWSFAMNTIGKLNNKIPYILARGNHDDWDDFNSYLHNGFYEKTLDGMMVTDDIDLSNPVDQRGVLKKVAADGSVSYVTRMGDVPSGGIVTGDITNSYRCLNVQGTDYIFITLDFAPHESTLAWLDQVLENHPNHKAIIVTHAYMYHNGTTQGPGDSIPPSQYDGYTKAQDGVDIWEKSLKKHENVYMVLSGHIPWHHIVYRQDLGNKGNTVTQMLIDPQGIDGYLDPRGMVAMFYFSEDEEYLTVRYYSVTKDCYGSELSQFTVHLEHKYEPTITPATFEKDGRIDYKCSCGEELESEVIPALNNVSFDQKSYTYDGYVKAPKVSVTDSAGAKLKVGKDYTVSYQSGRKKPGVYTGKITFTGKYSGTKEFSFTIHPKKAGNLKATQTISSITLNWDKAQGASGYVVYQYRDGKWKKIKDIKNASGTSYKASDLKAGTTYRYRVKSYTVKGSKRVYSVDAPTITTSTSLKKPKKLTATRTSSSVTLKWGKVTGATGYVIYQYKAGKWVKIKDCASKANLSYNVKSLKANTTYKFRIKAYKAVEKKKVWSPYSEKIKVVTKIKAPTIKTLTSAKGKVKLTWTNVKDESGYEVYFATKKGAAFKKVLNAKANHLKATKDNLKRGKTYYFKIRAYKLVNNKKEYSSWSKVKNIQVK